ncbi:hypothetical protein HRbin06_00862 [archaeon HR06]|nr:hypothetical protein HRbin06_00862 [archaeon HR06]
MLQVSLIVELQCPWLNCIKHQGKFTILQCIPRSKGVSALAKIEGPPWDSEKVTKIILKHPLVKKAKFIALTSSQFLGLVETQSCPCSLTILPNYNTLRISSEGEDKLRWTLLLDGYRSFKRLLHLLEKQGVSYKVDEIVKVKEKKFLLTPKQEEILRICLDLGFYDIPRKIELKDLAKILGISARALSERIRRAHKRLVLKAVREVESI